VPTGRVAARRSYPTCILLQPCSHGVYPSTCGYGQKVLPPRPSAVGTSRASTRTASLPRVVFMRSTTCSYLPSANSIHRTLRSIYLSAANHLQDIFHVGLNSRVLAWLRSLGRVAASAAVSQRSPVAACCGLPHQNAPMSAAMPRTSGRMARIGATALRLGLDCRSVLGSSPVGMLIAGHASESCISGHSAVQSRARKAQLDRKPGLLGALVSADPLGRTSCGSAGEQANRVRCCLCH
jgi:hypothetical protein